MLQKQSRLTRKQDFKKVYSGGQAYVHRLFILKMLDRRGDLPSRYGFVTSSKIGKAVQRNRARRLFREAVRLLILEGGVRECGCDVVMIARTPARESSLEKVLCAAREQFRKAGLLTPKDGSSDLHG